MRVVQDDGSIAGALSGSPDMKATTEDGAAVLNHEMERGDSVVYVISNKAFEVGGKNNSGADSYMFKVARR